MWNSGAKRLIKVSTPVYLWTSIRELTLLCALHVWIQVIQGDQKVSAPDDCIVIIRCKETFWSPCIKTYTTVILTQKLKLHWKASWANTYIPCIPTTALIFRYNDIQRVLNLLHARAFFGHPEGGIQQRKYISDYF